MEKRKFYALLESPFYLYELSDEAKEIIDEFCERLTNKEVEFVNYRYRQSLPYEEVAERLNYTIRNIFKLRHKILNKFWAYIVMNDKIKELKNCS